MRLPLSRGMACPERGRRDAPNLSYPNEVIGYLYFFGFPIKTFGNDKAKWITTTPDEFIGENQEEANPLLINFVIKPILSKNLFD